VTARLPAVTAAVDASDRATVNRRSFLVVTTAAVGAVGVAAAAWPLIHQMDPDAGTRAGADLIEVDASEMPLAGQRMVRWHNVPVSVVRRTAAMLEAMREPAFVAALIDPDSRMRQQPAYAQNWHRSVDPAYAVLAMICTHCGCVPHYQADAFPSAPAGGYICPCCASRYDPAGRAYGGAAQHNLPVPPYAIARPSRIVIGRNPAGEIFSLESVERI
jgi:ubiquinol-cytochrome c reductase iron-sulfur subunit